VKVTFISEFGKVSSTLACRTFGNQSANEVLKTLSLAAFEPKKFHTRLTRADTAQDSHFHINMVSQVGELQFQVQNVALLEPSFRAE
jgi:predicted dinucleotide-utilizing enzyme